MLRKTRVGELLTNESVALCSVLARKGFFRGHFPHYRPWLRRIHDARPPAPVIDGPKISVVVPTLNPVPGTFAAMLRSLNAQTYENWEAVICDDGSRSGDSMAILARAADEPRVHLVRHAVNRGVAAATNTALEAAQGDIICFLDHDDMLAPDGLASVAEAFHTRPDLILAYTDEDKLDVFGRRCDPYFKPDFDRALLYRRNYINHLTAIRTEVVRDMGGLRENLDGAQDYDLVLRVFERAGAKRIMHVPRIAYHWRTSQGAKGFSQARKAEAMEARRLALAQHLDRIGQAGSEVEGGDEMKVSWPVPHGQAISVIIPTRDRIETLARCVADLRSSAEEMDLQIVIVDNNSVEQRSRDWFAQAAALPDMTIVHAPGPFNFSALINLGARHATADTLLILNNDVYGGRPGWLRAMAGEALRPWAGAVGAKLLYPDGRLQHGGVVLGMGGSAGHYMKGGREHEAGPSSHLRLTRTVSAVTGACLMIRRAVFDAVGGFDAEQFPIGFSDVDFCLRVSAAGFENVWTPDAVLIHEEGGTRGREPADHPRLLGEIARLRMRWGEAVTADPWYNSNLSTDSEWPALKWSRAGD